MLRGVKRSFLESPVDGIAYHRTHLEKRRGHFSKSLVDENVYRRSHAIYRQRGERREDRQRTTSRAMEAPGWEKSRVQIDSDAIDTVSQKETAQAFEMKETAMSKVGVGYVAANGGWGQKLWRETDRRAHGRW